MSAHYHGQTWNAAEFARALGASETTARRYLAIHRVWIVYPGDEAYDLDDRIAALPVADVPRLAASLERQRAP